MGKKKSPRNTKLNQQAPKHLINTYALFEAGRYREVIRLCSQNLQNPSQDPQLAFLVAASYFRLDDKDECLDLLLRVETQLDDDPGYHSLLGATYRRLGLLHKAENHLHKALALSPSSNDIKNNFANLLIDLSKYDAAERLLRDILEDNPEHADARLNQQRLASFLTDQQQTLQKAATTSGQPFTKTAEHQKWSLPDPLLAAFDVSLLADREIKNNKQLVDNPNPIVQDIQLPETSRDDVAREQLRIVSGMIEEGQFNTALELISAAHQGFTVVSPDIFLHAADIFTRLGKFSEAELCNLHAIALGNRSFACFANLVSLATMRGDCKLAAHYFKEAQAIDAEDQRLTRLRDQIRLEFESIGRRYNFCQGWHNQA